MKSIGILITLSSCGTNLTTIDENSTQLNNPIGTSGFPIPPITISAWAYQFGTSKQDQVSNITVDSVGNTYIVGTTKGKIGAGLRGDDGFLIKLDKIGVEQWKVVFGGMGDDAGNSVTASPSGSIYVVGSEEYVDTAGKSQDRAFFVEYNNTGVELSRESFGIDLTSNRFFDISIDNSRKLYMTGSQYDPNFKKSEILLVKYDPMKKSTNRMLIDGGLLDNDNGSRIKIGSSGEIYIAGWRGKWRSATSQDAVLIKLNSDLSIVWEQYKDISTADIDRVTGLVVAPSGDIYVDGYTAGPMATSEGFVAKVDGKTGGLVWKESVDPGQFTEINGLALDSKGSIYVAGAIDDGFTGSAVIYKFEDLGMSGNKLWTRTFGATGGLTWATAIAVDDSDALRIAGNTDIGVKFPVPPMSDWDIFVLRAPW